ncbi:hypothetical protein ACWC09_50330 [Streptomyces sp. NPDC001617]
MVDTNSIDWGPSKKKAPPPPKPQEFDSTTFHAPDTRSGPQKKDLTPPAVPGSGSGSGGETSVHTASMDLFASNMDKLGQPVQDAYQKLLSLKQVNPGAFYDAYALREVTCGANGDSGIQNTYLKMLHDLGDGLADISSGMRKLSAKYTTVEEESKMTADDLDNAMKSAQGDFTKMGSGG